MTDHDILIRIAADLKNMGDRLYGENGDIPKILVHLEKINGTQTEHHGRISRVEMGWRLGKALILTGIGSVLSLTAALVLKILGVY